MHFHPGSVCRASASIGHRSRRTGLLGVRRLCFLLTILQSAGLFVQLLERDLRALCAIRSIISRVSLGHVKKLSVSGRQIQILALGIPLLRTLDVDFSRQFVDSDTRESHWASSGTWNHPLTQEVTALIVPLTCLLILVIRTDWSDLDNDPAWCSTALMLPLLNCRCVETVQFQLDHSPTIEKRDNNGTWNDTTMALTAIQGTFNELCLGVSDDRASFELACLHLFEPVESFPHLSALEQLRLPHQALVHEDYGTVTYEKLDVHEFFPNSLRAVTIMWPEPNIVGWMADLVVAKLPGSVSINTITFECDEEFGVSAEWLQGQRDMFVGTERAGIMVTINTRGGNGRVIEMGKAEDIGPSEGAAGHYFVGGDTFLVCS